MQAEPLNLRLWPKQGQAFLTTATEVFYGGSAGGGKSHVLRVAAIAWCLDIPGLKVGLFRRGFSDLWENHMLAPTAFPAMLASLVASKHCRISGNSITFYNGSRIDLHHCQHEKNRFNYQGAEFHVLMIDELTHFPETIYRYLRSRVRMTGVQLPPRHQGKFPRIIASGNPGGIGHTWVKRTFVEPPAKSGEAAPPPLGIYRTAADEGAMLRQYIPSRLQDNPSLDFEEYSAKLSGLGDPILVRAMLDGDWKIAAGSMFGEAWRDELHTCAPFPVPIDWPLWFGGDDGHAAPSSILYGTQHPTTGTFYVVASIHQAGLLPTELAERMKRMEKAIPRWHGPGDVRHNATRVKGLYDSAAWADHGEGTDRGEKSISRGAQLQACGILAEPCEKWQGSRVHGVQNFHRLLAPNPKDPKGLPSIRFFTTCRNAIEEIPALPRDKNDPEDVSTDGEDHSWDACRYFLQYRQRRVSSKRVG